MQTAAYQAGGSSMYLIKADQYQSGELRGRLDNVRLAGEKSFSSTFQLLQLVQELIDTGQCPGGANRELQSLYQNTGGAGTFQLEVLFTQNQSWQGRLTWLEKRQEVSFRSVLELMMLLDEALAA